jgi:ATP-dependent DNA ligase
MSKRSVAASRLEFIPPQIPTLVDQPPEGDGWIHEVKFDGYRAQIGEARVFTRNGPTGRQSSGRSLNRPPSYRPL